MFKAVGRTVGSQTWYPVVNSALPMFEVNGQIAPFTADKGLIELMVEKMKEKYPDIEYHVVPA